MTQETMTAYDFAVSLLEKLEDEGFEARLVGGCVRDKLLGLEPKDYDIATDALPKETTKVLEASRIKVVPTGVEYGTVTAVASGHSVEITTLREDVETDGRRAKVKFGKSFEKDAARRDFTINSLSCDLRGKVFDYFEGEKHLKEKKLIFVGDAETRIREDFLRILRLYRFKARFGFSFEDSLEKVLSKTMSGLEKVSQERITGELEEIFSSLHRTLVLKSFVRTGILHRAFPFLSEKASFSKRLVDYVESSEKSNKKGSLTSFLAAALLFSNDGKSLSFHGEAVIEAASYLKISIKMKEEIMSLVSGFLLVGEGFSDQASLLLFAKNCDKKKKTYFFRDTAVPFWLEISSFFKEEKEVSENIKSSLLTYSRNHFRLVSPPLIETKEVMELLSLKQGIKLGKVLEERDRAFLNGEIETKEAMEAHLKEKFL